ncbi:MAG TPA: hypothetical protein VGE10_05375 [Zeimonas sp.]
MSIDRAKLAELRDGFERMHADYRSLAAQAREAATASGRLRAELFVDPLAESASPLARASVEELDRMPVAELEKAGINVRTVRQLVIAEQRARALAAKAARTAEELKNARALLDRVEAYARQFEHEAPK